MNVKDAANVAKDWVTNVLSDEKIFNVALEEIEFDQEKREWLVTVGFSRPWNTLRNALTSLTGDPAVRRAFRVITVRDRDGEVISMKRRGSED
jgi:hypothetical protein